jgi:hypothetical protein
MPIVYGVNPTHPRRPCGKGKVKNMEENPRKRKKRSTKKAPKTRTRTKTVTKWRTRNPAKPKRNFGGKGRVRRGFAALDIGSAARGAVALVGGMIIAKAAVNKITAGGSETELWSWPNIATAALSGFIAAFVLGAVFNLSQNVTRLVFMGGLALAMFKAFTTKLAPKWGWTQTWFGADEDINPALLGAGAEGGDIDIFQPVPVDGYGEDTYEVVDGYGDAQQDRLLQEMGFSGLTPYNPAMGAVLAPPQPEMGTEYSPYPSSVLSASRRLVTASANYPGSY